MDTFQIIQMYVLQYQGFLWALAPDKLSFHLQVCYMNLMKKTFFTTGRNFKVPVVFLSWLKIMPSLLETWNQPTSLPWTKELNFSLSVLTWWGEREVANVEGRDIVRRGRFLGWGKQIDKSMQLNPTCSQMGISPTTGFSCEQSRPMQVQQQQPQQQQESRSLSPPIRLQVCA